MKPGKIGLLFAALCAMAGMAAAQVEMEDTTKVDIAPPPSAGVWLAEVPVGTGAGPVTPEKLAKGTADPSEWLHYGGGYDNFRHSPVTTLTSESVQRLKEDLHEIEVDLPKSYVTKDDFNQTMKHIESMFQRIYDKLDNKADK